MFTKKIIKKVIEKFGYRISKKNTSKNTERNGKNCTINYSKNFKIGSGSSYNDFCWFNARFGIIIGKNTLIGPFVLIHSANHVIKNIDIEQNELSANRWCKDINKRVKGDPIIIGDDVWIGTNVTILTGVKIPDKCVVGAGTILTKENCKMLKRGDIVVNDIKLRVLDNRKNINN